LCSKGENAANVFNVGSVDVHESRIIFENMASYDQSDDSRIKEHFLEGDGEMSQTETRR
jgi:hypothetical protein